MNILAISVLECTEVGTVRLVVSNPDKAAKALDEAGMAFMKTDVLVATVPNKVGVLAEVAQKLAAKRVNVNFIYGSTGKGRGATHIVLGCNRKPTAQKVLAAY